MRGDWCHSAARGISGSDGPSEGQRATWWLKRFERRRDEAG